MARFHGHGDKVAYFFIAVGVYLLCVAAAGYYVRYFGGDWGRPFQLAVLFAALLMRLSPARAIKRPRLTVLL